MNSLIEQWIGWKKPPTWCITPWSPPPADFGSDAWRDGRIGVPAGTSPPSASRWNGCTAGRTVHLGPNNSKNVKAAFSLPFVSLLLGFSQRYLLLTCSSICVPLSSFTFLFCELMTEACVLLAVVALSDNPCSPTTP